MDADQFIARWSTATISERAHYQTFISQLCALIGAPAPDEEKAGDLDYCFERPVRFSHEDGSGHVHYIDCYRRDCFVLEAKQSGKRQSGGELDPRRQLALFVMQCIFCMFADSVGLIEKRGFLSFLESYRGQADQFHKGASDFFQHMDTGGHCSAIRQDLKRFNGGLFRHVAALEINEVELAALIEAAKRDWASVEPAIFGALLEQALDPAELSELGAHYTPRAYVERLVEPTLMEPLRADWEAAEANAIGLYLRGEEKAARRVVKDFHRQLCAVRVLDPACGTGNFLYVALRMMKELEGEVLGVLAEMGEAQGLLELDGHTVSPEQFWGLEKNAYAA